MTTTDRLKATTRTVPSLAAATVVALLGIFMSACTSAGPQPSPDPGGAASPTASASGQGGETGGDALYYYPPVEGATLRFANSGMTTSTSDVTVDTVTSGADGTTVAVTEVVSGSGDPVTVEQTYRTGADGSLSIDASAFAASAPGFTATATGEDILIPAIAQLESGGESSGETFVELSGSGVTMRNDVTYTVKGGGFASITVPAGTMDAYVVNLTLDITSSVAGSIAGTSRYWFVPGFGLVRQEATFAGTAGVTELSSTSVPLP